MPDDFTFSIKASNYLTHFKRLLDPEEPVARLLDHATPMGARLEVVLVQLPSTLHAEPGRLDATLRAFGGRVRVAVEPRHYSWFCDDVLAVLESHDAAMCLADRDSRLVTPEWRTASWTYVRLHGGRARPPSAYSRQALETWAERLHTLFGDDADGYVYFNNDADAYALRDAVVFARAAARAGMRVSRVPPRSEIAVT